MKSIFNLVWGGTLLLSFGIVPTWATSGDFTKTIEKSFSITSDGTSELSSRYGKMEVKTWDKNEVKIKVDIVVDASSEQKAEKVFDLVDIEFESSNDFVSAVTDIEHHKGNHKFKIYYEAYIPKTNNLNATMKYGTLHVEELLGKADITVKYGHFQLEAIGDQSKIYLAYSNGTCQVENAKDLEVSASYSRIHIEKAEDIQLSAKYTKDLVIERANSVVGSVKYSNLEAEKLNEIRIEAGYSNFKLGKLEDVHIRANYSNFRVEAVKNVLDVELGYNGMKIEEVGANINYVNLVGKYANFEIEKMRATDYQLDISARYGSVNVPDGIQIVDRDKGNTSLEMKGYMGNPDAKSKVKADMSYGNFKMYQQSRE